ncbi:MAG: dihydrolipoyl dehydrogenase [Sphingomonadales bacterium]|nr:dihydrolipoyl dehydrogenase [Sphingomonadales bacterium]PIX65104.1 MAG: dihydrolipoyl dehydrogenase [Sphingomonadales bacterium CG_4_10_14_3_um_filter_58_15]NCO48066.1 dihydrolipoyl dehydrogenase [Sphingomonadales bacterium]NCO99636.1 dihydrolipoyl dehydrogenase [Sphingomonadales bacterium]NCP27199.1 dihydrolipoyl dehydrogenase [Sphingomonadales bacterium]
MAETLQCDVAVIGAGTAGLAAERAARANGASTLLIDPYYSGTTCATVGCMPSKLLIAASHAAHAARSTDMFGITVSDVAIDGKAVLQRVRDERDRFARLTRESIDDIPAGIRLSGKAKFVAPDRLELDDGRQIKARSIVIATGSTPFVPGEFAGLGKRLLTTESIFELPDLPERLGVVGSGAIGLELAQAMARLDVDVTLFDHGEQLGGIRCPKVHDALKAIIEADLTLKLGVELEVKAADDGVTLAWDGASSGQGDFDYVLIATGRPPNLESLNLSATGLELDDDGVPVHDRDSMQCGESSTFLAGDLANDLPLLHEASQDGAIAGRNAVAFPASTHAERFTPFSIIFTSPPVARIGQSEDDGVITGTADFSDQGRARVEGVNEGVLTLYAAAPDGRLIGADLCTPASEHLAHMLAWAIQQGQTATQLLEMPFYHPTIEEGLKQALRTICAATPLELPENQDRGVPAGA